MIDGWRLFALIALAFGYVALIAAVLWGLRDKKVKGSLYVRREASTATVDVPTHDQIIAAWPAPSISMRDVARPIFIAGRDLEKGDIIEISPFDHPHDLGEYRRADDKYLAPMISTSEEGDLCPLGGCLGCLIRQQEPCTCATMRIPPCGACVSGWLECGVCGAKII